MKMLYGYVYSPPYKANYGVNFTDLFFYSNNAGYRVQ